MNWKPGDIAVVCACTTAPEFNGKTVTVTSNEYISMDNDFIEKPCVDIDSGSAFWLHAFTYLLRKPYDGNELCKWSDVIWQPKELVRTVFGNV